MSGTEKKVVCVAGKTGCAADIIVGILKLCGRDGCIEVVKGTQFPEIHEPTVLLLCQDCGGITAGECQCVVSEYSLARNIKNCNPKTLRTYSSKTDAADFTARNIRVTPDGFTAFEIVGVGIIGRVRLNTQRSGVIDDVLAAAAAAVETGIPFADVLKALNSAELGRLCL